MSLLTNAEQLADAYERGYLQGKVDTHEKQTEQTLIYVRTIERLIDIAARKGEWESLTYARQLLRRLYGNDNKA